MKSEEEEYRKQQFLIKLFNTYSEKNKALAIENAIKRFAQYMGDKDRVIKNYEQMMIERGEGQEIIEQEHARKLAAYLIIHGYDFTNTESITVKEEITWLIKKWENVKQEKIKNAISKGDCIPKETWEWNESYGYNYSELDWKTDSVDKYEIELLEKKINILWGAQTQL